MEKMYLDRQTTDGTQLTIAQLAEICPAAIAEVADPKTGNICRKVNFDMLRLMLGDLAVENPHEVYDFTWVGKTEAARNAAKSITKTLRPCESESVDWEHTQNLYIEGENLEVLKLLQNSYDRSVNMIYIDPPYNTGKDRIYADDFSQTQDEYDKTSKAKDELGNRFRVNSDSDGRFHSKWCSMMYERLLACRSMLTDDGVIFISIDHHEVVNLSKLCDEIFGDGNRIGILSVVNNLKGRSDDDFFATCNEFLLCYAKNKSKFIIGGFEVEEEELDNDYNQQDQIGFYKLVGYRKTGNAWSWEARPKMFYPVLYKDSHFYAIDEDELKKIYNEQSNEFDEEFIAELTKQYQTQGYTVIWPKTQDGEYGRWRWGFDKFLTDKDDNLALNDAGTVCTKMRATIGNGSIRVKTAKTLWYKPEYDTGSGAKALDQVMGKKDLFKNPKSTVFLTDIIRICTDNDKEGSKSPVFLDFFSGSATTAQAIMQLNAADGGHRKFIMVQYPDNLSGNLEKATNDEKKTIQNCIEYLNQLGKPILLTEFAKERIRRVGSKIKAKHPKVDTGFRVLKVDETNYKQVAFTPNEFSQGMIEGLIDNIKDDRNDLDLLFECMLRWGVKLSEPISKSIVDNCSILNVNDGDLVACLDRQGKITKQVIDAIAEMHPLRVVLLDVVFNEASQKMNIFEQFKQRLGWQDNDVAQKIRVI